MLRAQASRNVDQYVVPTHESPGFSCSACLGVLHESSISKITSLFRNQVSEFSHDNRLRINATIPAAISVIRDRAFHIFSARHASSPSPGTKLLKLAAVAVPLREAFKWTLSGRIEKLFGVRYDADSQLFMDVYFNHPQAEHEASFFADSKPPVKARRKNDSPGSQMYVSRVVESMSDNEFEEKLPSNWIPPPPSVDCVAVDIQVSSSPVYIAGAYKKFSRIVSQTPWFIEDGTDPADKKRNVHQRHYHSIATEQSDTPSPIISTQGTEKSEQEPDRNQRTEANVEDVVLKGIKSVFKPEKALFSAGGREDVDVRMLGEGRPFLVELVNPKIIPACVTAKHIQAAVPQNSGPDASSIVTVNDLRLVGKEHGAAMKEYETSKRKYYRCVVWCEKPHVKDQLARLVCDHAQNGEGADEGLMLYQKTPLRVLHRRTQLTRERKIYSIKISNWVSNHFFVLDVEAQAGTYIKEFIHGDHGRTTPSVASFLGCDVDILQLDVVRIEHK